MGKIVYRRRWFTCYRILLIFLTHVRNSKVSAAVTDNAANSNNFVRAYLDTLFVHEVVTVEQRTTFRLCHKCPESNANTQYL